MFELGLVDAAVQRCGQNSDVRNPKISDFMYTVTLITAIAVNRRGALHEQIFAKPHE